MKPNSKYKMPAKKMVDPDAAEEKSEKVVVAKTTKPKMLKVQKAKMYMK